MKKTGTEKTFVVIFELAFKGRERVGRERLRESDGKLEYFYQITGDKGDRSRYPPCNVLKTSVSDPNDRKALHLTMRHLQYCRVGLDRL